MFTNVLVLGKEEMKGQNAVSEVKIYAHNTATKTIYIENVRLSVGGAWENNSVIVLFEWPIDLRVADDGIIPFQANGYYSPIDETLDREMGRYLTVKEGT